jgi:adenylate cyclase class 2
VQNSRVAEEALMADANSPTETEVKICLAVPGEIDSRLIAAGFIITKPRVFEANTVYDKAGDPLRAQGCLLRLRQVSDTAIVTYKGPAQRGKHKTREELETTVGDFVAAALILDRLGYAATFRYEKYRTEYERPGEHGVVTVDETPVGWFLELEGLPEWIDRTAGVLGYSETDYVVDSYGSLYLQHCTFHGIKPTHMVFEAASERSGESTR